jgi:hypothetical protein
MSSDANPFTEQDLEFLQRPLYGFVSVAAGPVPPQPRPIWFEATAERTIQLFTGPDTAKARRLRRDPRAIRFGCRRMSSGSKELQHKMIDRIVDIIQETHISARGAG